MKTIKIGGVPEHFNYPWYLGLKNGDFKSEGINLRWRDYFGGTGEMTLALRNGEIDLAVILTEGIVKDIVEGNDCKIVQVFVNSPLIWGVHVANDSNYKSITEVKGQKAAISRYGSGSHLMAYIHAQNNGWDLEKDLNFEVVKDLKGAVASLTQGESDYFLWEKFTTKPIVDDGVFRIIDHCPTPWPCFVIAVRNEILQSDPDCIQTILELINAQTLNFKSINDIDFMLASRYDQKLEDIREWLSLTEWSQKNIDINQLNSIQDELLALNIISNTLPSEEFVFNF
ncbi:MAG: ABC transporter substrate-binding protein [Bacteroidetes bacterium MedPE-SWsnd-G2]|nr:MAG: ABC transporter substrate-binding protein [Bacteroidetes bacterium MedPE-SWsnd-G2]